VSVATILGIVSAVLGLLKSFVSYTEQKKWMEAGEAQAVRKGIEDADQVVKHAREARQDIRDQHVRDPDSIMRDDPFKRPD